MYIEKINGPEDVKKIEVAELPKLAEEMRHALLIRASKHGGHFGPNFGMVEATIALQVCSVYDIQDCIRTLCDQIISGYNFLQCIW